MTKTHTYSIASAILISLLAAGCGGGGDSPAAASAPASNSTGTSGTGTTGTDTGGTGTTGTGTTGTGTTGTGTTGTGTTGTGTTGTGTSTLTYAPGMQAAFTGQGVFLGKSNTLFSISSTGQVVQSANGTDWTNQVDKGVGSETGIRSAKFINNSYVTVGKDISVSADADTWTIYPSTTGWPENFFDVAGDNTGKIVAVGKPNATAGQAPLVFSSNGSVWNPITPNGMSDKDWSGVAFGNSKFVAVGTTKAFPSMGYVATSADGQVWIISPAAVSPSDAFQKIHYSSADAKFIATSNGGKTFSSADGTNWAQATIDSVGRNILQIQCNNAKTCIAATASSGFGSVTLLRRNASEVWAPVSYAPAIEGSRANSYSLTTETILPFVKSISYVGTKWIAVGNTSAGSNSKGFLLESTDDGLTWARIASR
jgi:hypothetical protein